MYLFVVYWNGISRWTEFKMDFDWYKMKTKRADSIAHTVHTCTHLGQIMGHVIQIGSRKRGL